MAEESVFISLLDRLKRGRTSRTLPSERGVLTGNVATVVKTSVWAGLNSSRYIFKK